MNGVSNVEALEPHVAHVAHVDDYTTTCLVGMISKPTMVAVWFKSASRRSPVERSFGNLKNEALQNMRRDTVRVRGHAPLSHMAIPATSCLGGAGRT